MRLASSHPAYNTLKACAHALKNANDRWWVLGGAAVSLHDCDPSIIRDIDLLLSLDDAKRLLSDLKLEDATDGGTEKYRSNLFLKPHFGAVPVEIMAGFQIKSDGVWRDIWPSTQQKVMVGDSCVYIPDIEELIDILTLLDRPKDQDRVKQLQRLLS